MKVVVSIVNYNTPGLTSDCLKGILSQKTNHEIEVWVVDNGSVDDSVAVFKKNFPKVNLIANPENLGFGKAHNQVLKKANGDYYLILNSDTKVEEDVVAKMVDFMEQNSCGLSSCQIIGFDGQLQPNSGRFPFGMALFGWLFNLDSLGFLTFHINNKKYYDNVKEVDWVSGNFMFIRKKVLAEVGYFNEAYFMYFEDVEYCFRINKKGFKIMLNPAVSIKHLSGGSLDDPKFRQWVGEYKGLKIFYQNLYGQIGEFLINFLIYPSIILRILAFSLIGKFNFSKTYAKVITKI